MLTAVAILASGVFGQYTLYTESPGCDYQNQGDFQHVNVPLTQCGQTCLSTAGCTHYSWVTDNGGTCWMKNGNIPSSSPSSTPGIVCGYLANASVQLTQHAGCDFQNQGDFQHVSNTLESSCGATCLSTSGCTRFSWVPDNGGTCWMKNGVVTWSDAQLSNTNGIFCGILISPPTPIVTSTSNGVLSTLPSVTTTSTTAAPSATYTERPGCDFKNSGDYKTIQISKDSCGSTCLTSDSYCTHYTWAGGSCYLKYGNAKWSDATNTNPQGTCGIVAGKVFPSPTIAIPSTPPNFTRLLSPADSSSFVKAQGTNFVLNGKNFYYAGTNTWEIQHYSHSDIDNFFDDCVQTKTSVVRYFVTLDPLRIDNGNLNWNDDANENQDYIFYSAAYHGIKMILIMVDNWNGMDSVFNKAYGSIVHSDFFVKSNQINAYKFWLYQFLNHVNRYTGIANKNDPTFMIIEMVNEARCSGKVGGDSNCNSSWITNWFDQISQFIKSIDSNHLIGTGEEGYYLNGNNFGDYYPPGCDYEGNARLLAVDVLGFHNYHGDSQDPTNAVNSVIEHVNTGKSVGKPVYMGEYGVSAANRDKSMPAIQYAGEQNGLAGDNAWIML